MRWDFHGIIIEGTTNDATLASRWQRSFSSLPASESTPDLRCVFELVSDVPRPPLGEPVYVHRHQSSYYISQDGVQIHFPDFGLLDLDFTQGETVAWITESCLETHGLLEDVVASGLSPHLRRSGFFLVHAFGAATAERAVLIVGDIGAGKTTTGLALLDAGWKLISNDSPIIASGGRVFSYPGFLAAFPDSLSMFAKTKFLAKGIPAQEKKEFTVESVWSNAWCSEAENRLILFPQVQISGGVELKPLSRAEALGRLLPHTIDSWDRPMVQNHVAVLEDLVETSPAFSLQIGRNLDAFSEVLSSELCDLI